MIFVRSVRALAAAGCILAAACSGGESGGSGSRARVDVGLPVPAYSATSITGDTVSLADHRGKVVLLNVWATWCHPCRDEIPELQALHEKYAARGLELVGVSVDTEGADESIREFMRDYKMTYPVWRDPGERISAQFHTVGVPTTFLIDRTGVLRWRKTGPIQPGDPALSSALEQALGA